MLNICHSCGATPQVPNLPQSGERVGFHSISFSLSWPGYIKYLTVQGGGWLSGSMCWLFHNYHVSCSSIRHFQKCTAVRLVSLSSCWVSFSSLMSQWEAGFLSLVSLLGMSLVVPFMYPNWTLPYTQSSVSLIINSQHVAGTYWPE